ncbi:MAG: AraC family transcriptional regulator [Bacteroidales bacterium]|nr:AraC family transcriptional regulator [Bacteroidales bacterium]
MEKTLPKIDIPVNFAIGTGINESILNLYKKYPCRLNAEIFVLCMGGTIKATINLTEYTVKTNDFVILTPGSIIQLHEITGELKIYFMVFSSKFINTIGIAKSLLDFMYLMKCNPVLSLPVQMSSIYQEYFDLLIRTNEMRPTQNPEIQKCILLSILYRLKELYQSQNTFPNTSVSNRNEEICNKFARLVIQHYAQERNISFYAKKIGITPTHLSNTVKQTLGKTVISIISEMVITDAKAQLKSTNLPINQIAESLNFPNVSFFGKYFKRYVGMGPQAYRNS